MSSIQRFLIDIDGLRDAMMRGKLLIEDLTGTVASGNQLFWMLTEFNQSLLECFSIAAGNIPAILTITNNPCHARTFDVTDDRWFAMMHRFQ